MYPKACDRPQTRLALTHVDVVLPFSSFVKPAAHSGMPRCGPAVIAGPANDATDYFQIPTNRVVEVGTQVTI